MFLTTLSDHEFVNLKDFICWLVDKIKEPEQLSVYPYLLEVAECAMNANSIYELQDYETKSRRPECYSFEAEERYCVSEYDQEFFDSFYGRTNPEEVKRCQKEGMPIEELERLYKGWGVDQDWQDWFEDHVDYVKTIIYF